VRPKLRAHQREGLSVQVSPFVQLLICAALGAAVPRAVASEFQPDGVQWAGSGFATLAAGKVLGGTHDPATDSGFQCPCMPTDYAHAGVYERGAWRLGPDSVLGLQATASLGQTGLSATGQVVSRGARDGRVNLEWLYATWDINSNWTLQAGRKRLPILAQSEVQDVGYAVPWVHLPPQVYGWEIVNYNGANLLYRGRLGDVSALVNVFGGSETIEDSPFWKMYDGRAARTDSRWSGLAGAELKLALAGAELRGVYITSKTQNRFVTGGDADYSTPARQHIWGLSASYDESNWVGRAEWIYINRRQDYGGDRASLVAVGRRFGPWLPMLSWSRYQQLTSTLPDEPAEGHEMTSVVLRRELAANSAIKLQLDRWQDRSAPGFAYPHGNRRLFSAAYVRVF
jgi:hypothetical protein